MSSYQDGVIRLDVNAGKNFTTDLKNGVLLAMSHELTHFIEQYAASEYAELRSFVFEVLTEKHGAEGVEALIQRKIDRAKQNGGRKISRSEAEAEVVADACEMLLRNSKTVQALVAEHRSLGEKIADWLQKFIAKVKAIFGDAEHVEARAVMEQLDRAQAIWDRALAAAVETHDQIGNEKTATEGGVQYSSRADVLALDDRVDWMANDSSVKDQLNKHQKEIAEAFPNGPIISIQYNGEIDADLDTAIMEQALKAGTPNETRTAAAFNRDGITFEFDLVGTRKIRGHASSNDALRAAAIISPYIARDGLRIAGQENHENTGLTTLTYAAPAIINGHSVNVGLVVRFMANGRPRAVNVETSGGEKLVISVTHEAQKKKSLDGTRGRTDNNPGTAPPRKAISSVITIPQNYADSNPSVKNNSEQHSDRDYLAAVERGDMATAQKMVDEAARKAGYSVHAYHGTTAEFNVFEGGAFFTDDYFNADGYAAGERVIDAYLKLENPLVVDANGAKWDELDTQYGSSTREIAENLGDEYDGIISARMCRRELLLRLDKRPAEAGLCA